METRHTFLTVHEGEGEATYGTPEYVFYNEGRVHQSGCEARQLTPFAGRRCSRTSVPLHRSTPSNETL